MNKVILVTGAARSGKSEWAEHLAMDLQNSTHKSIIYVATAMENPEDAEWQQRIEKHQQRRPENWLTLSTPVDLITTVANADPNYCLLVDSLGTWVANLLEQEDITWQQTITKLLATVQLTQADLIFVAEETGWGVVPAYPIGRKFRDRLGNLIRQLSGICHTVYLVTGGYALNLTILGIPLPPIKS
jgi:adenosylcobinamide kinase/adenosylcobinamide-phosphate guanylyltransferase